MGQVHITILGRSYALDCDAGQEPHLTKLADRLNWRLQELSQRMPATNDHDLLAMLALTLLDEMNETTQPNPDANLAEIYKPQLSALADRLDRLNRLVATVE